MHLIVPFASALSEAAAAALLAIDWRSLGGFAAGARLGSDEWSLSPPHEQAIAQALGWRGGDGALPFAASAARADGIDPGTAPIARLTPVHWHVGRDQVLLTDPAGLELGDAESRAFLEAIRPLLESDGFTLHYGSATRWYACSDELDGLACGSLDRAIGRAVDPWLPSGPAASHLRRLQNEVQMLLYTHPLNAAREARGARPVNSFWIDGCGRAEPIAGEAPQVDRRLAEPALGGDWPAWQSAWQALVAGPAHEADRLTLCGERFAQTFERRARPWWQRFGASPNAPSAAMIEAL
jgi:hypothetical protein